MALAIILFGGFIGVALTFLVAFLAFIDVAFNLSDSDRRARQDANVTVQAEAELSPRAKLARIHQWVQSA